MKKLKYTIVLTIMTLMSCGGGASNQPATVEGFSEIEKEIKKEFGKDAYYTDLTITYNKSIGNIIGVTVTADPSSLKMGQWNHTQGVWQQNQEISLEVPQGTRAQDFMFQLDDKINLSILGELAEKASSQLKTKKNIKSPMLNMAFIKFPKNGDSSKMEYSINMKPESGGTTFRFNYSLNGDLVKMDY